MAPSVSSRASSSLPSKLFTNHITDHAESFGNRVKKGSVRKFNFASSQYASCFKDLPKPDVAKLRKDAMEYLDSFDGKTWYDDPVRFFVISKMISLYYCSFLVCKQFGTQTIIMGGVTLLVFRFCNKNIDIVTYTFA